MQEEIVSKIKTLVKGEVLTDEKTLEEYSRDASVCEVVPQIIVCPKDKEDIKALVKFVYTNKEKYPNLSITVRSAGTDMSGGPLGESIILDVNKHMKGVLGFAGHSVSVLPGTLYRDFEKETLKRGLFLPSYPASKNICTVGGMVGNNAAGEKTLVYGQTLQYVKVLKIVLEDGNEYEILPLHPHELELKIEKGGFEGNLYKKIFDLVSKNQKEIKEGKPKTAKNASGYYLWEVWNTEAGKDREVFDLTKIIVGSQGTLGIITEITFELMPSIPETRMLAIYVHDLKAIPEIVHHILPFSPSSLESFDEATAILSVKYFKDLLMTGSKLDGIKLFYNFIPEFLMYFFYGFPKMIMLAEFGGKDGTVLEEKVLKARAVIKKAGFPAKAVFSTSEARKFWTIRRESYNLLRKHAEGKKIATFIEDVVVPPEHLFEFLPRLNEILHSYDLTYSIAGHAGSGNFHVFPLINFNDPHHVEKIMEISDKVYDLVVSFKGSITAEHNDGISRTPYLHKMYSPKMLELFKETKNIFDSKNIFNPGKKVGGTIKFFKEHILKSS